MKKTTSDFNVLQLDNRHRSLFGNVKTENPSIGENGKITQRLVSRSTSRRSIEFTWEAIFASLIMQCHRKPHTDSMLKFTVMEISKQLFHKIDDFIISQSSRLLESSTNSIKTYKLIILARLPLSVNLKVFPNQFFIGREMALLF